MEPTELALSAGAGLALGALLHARLGAALDGLRRRRRWRRAKRGAAAADGVLEGARARVEAAEVQGGYVLWVDGAPHEVSLRVDRRVRRRGRARLAEIKTGAKGADPLHEPTRRQLLEYALAFDTPELLLVDMETRRVRVVRFPFPARRGGRGRLVVSLTLGLAAGLALGRGALRLPAVLEPAWSALSAAFGW